LTKLGGAGRSAGTQGQLNNGRATAPVASTLNLQPETLLWADCRLPPPLSPLPSPSFSSNPDSLCLLHPPSPRSPSVNWRDISWFVIAFWRKTSVWRCASPAQSSPAPSPLLVDRHMGATSSLPFDICMDKLPVHPRHLPPLCQLLPIFLCSLHPSMFYPIGEPHYFALLSFLPKFLFPVHTVQSYHISSGGQPPIPPDPPPPFRKIEPHTIASESLENDLASSMQALQISDLPMHQTRCWPTTRICLHRSCRLWCCHRRFAAPPASYAARATPQSRSAAAPHLAPLRPSSATSQGRGVGPQQRRATFAHLGRGGAAPAAVADPLFCLGIPNILGKKIVVCRCIYMYNIVKVSN